MCIYKGYNKYNYNAQQGKKKTQQFKGRKQTKIRMKRDTQRT
jgi:hypothetical protein